MTEQQITAVVESAEEHKPQSEGPRPLRRTMEPAAPYPVHALGKLLSAAALAIHDRVQAPIAICAQSVLAAVTLAIQGHADVMLPHGQTRPLSNFFLTIAETGERKSSADKEALSAVEAHEKKLQLQYEKDYFSWQNSHATWKKQRDIILADKKRTLQEKKGALEALGQEPQQPLIPMLTCPEPSFEGLCKFLVNGQPSVGVFSGEGGQFIGGYSMGEDARMRTAAGLSSLWDGETVKRVRAGDGTTILPGRRVSLHLMVQPQIASQFLNDLMLADQGLLSRVLVAAPDSTAGTRLHKQENAQTEVDLEQYRQRIAGILDAPLPLVEGKTNELKPRVLNMSADAKTIHTNFSDKIEKLIAQNGPMYCIKGLANKLPELAARLAGVLALADDLSRSEITPEYMEAGIELVNFYAAEAIRLKNASTINKDILDAEKLLHWLHVKWREPLISLPTIYQKGPEQFSTAEDARKAVLLLEEHGWLEKIEGSIIIQGKPRRDVWKIIKEQS